jgi:glycosyltransferase involved in cell wall biosynthesis
VCQDETRDIFEDRLLAVLGQLQTFRPTAVLANLSAQSFEVLRYVPNGVFRTAIAHSDDPLVYATLKRYPGHMDLLAVVSEIMREKTAVMPEFAGIPIKYLPCGVPMPKNGFAPREFSGPLRILYLGRVEREQKRVHLFPRILENLKSSGMPFHWTIAGDGPERAWLEDELKGNPPAQTISFSGKISYEDVPKLLEQHDVFLLASDYEGLPLALLEAMGFGLVPVVSDLASGVRELVNEQTGKRVAVENVSGYAEAIVWLHEHREAMKQLSQNAGARVREQFSIKAMTDRWLDALPRAEASMEWPQRWNIRRPLTDFSRLRFSWPGRVAKRMALKLSSR